MYIWREKVAGDVTADIVNTGLYPLDVVDGFKIRPEYGAFPDRPYDSPGVWGDAEKIKKIMKNR